ncbi:MAG: lipocalin family protein [Leptospirales bacterium]|nr:lipocalin family protein [Leptospirales bacterium]
MKIIQYFYFILLISIISCSVKSGIRSDESINYELYQGKWYEIARLPNSFEEGLICITMTYAYEDDGIMTLTSSGKNKNDPNDTKSFTAKAWIPDENEPQKIKIQFVWPITFDCTLIHIDEAKGYAIIGSPNKKQLWVLSRQPMINENDIYELKSIAEKNQYNTDKFVYVDQICD